MISLSLNIALASGSYSPVLIDIEGDLTEKKLSEIKMQYEVDGATVASWSAEEKLPYDEGYSAAMRGDVAEMNPYAKSFWKHDEWCLGWDSYHESNV